MVYRPSGEWHLPLQVQTSKDMQALGPRRARKLLRGVVKGPQMTAPASPSPI